MPRNRGSSSNVGGHVPYYPHCPGNERLPPHLQRGLYFPDDRDKINAQCGMQGSDYKSAGHSMGGGIASDHHHHPPPPKKKRRSAAANSSSSNAHPPPPAYSDLLPPPLTGYGETVVASNPFDDTPVEVTPPMPQMNPYARMNSRQHMMQNPCLSSRPPPPQAASSRNACHMMGPSSCSLSLGASSSNCRSLSPSSASLVGCNQMRSSRTDINCSMMNPPHRVARGGVGGMSSCAMMNCTDGNGGVGIGGIMPDNYHVTHPVTNMVCGSGSGGGAAGVSGGGGGGRPVSSCSVSPSGHLFMSGSGKIPSYADDINAFLQKESGGSQVSSEASAANAAARHHYFIERRNSGGGGGNNDIIGNTRHNNSNNNKRTGKMSSADEILCDLNMSMSMGIGMNSGAPTLVSTASMNGGNRSCLGFASNPNAACAGDNSDGNPIIGVNSIMSSGIPQHETMNSLLCNAANKSFPFMCNDTASTASTWSDNSGNSVETFNPHYHPSCMSMVTNSSCNDFGGGGGVSIEKQTDMSSLNVCSLSSDSCMNSSLYNASNNLYCGQQVINAHAYNTFPAAVGNNNSNVSGLHANTDTVERNLLQPPTADCSFYSPCSYLSNSIPTSSIPAAVSSAVTNNVVNITNDIEEEITASVTAAVAGGSDDNANHDDDYGSSYGALCNTIDMTLSTIDSVAAAVPINSNTAVAADITNNSDISVVPTCAIQAASFSTIASTPGIPCFDDVASCVTYTSCIATTTTTTSHPIAVTITATAGSCNDNNNNENGNNDNDNDITIVPDNSITSTDNVVDPAAIIVTGATINTATTSAAAAAATVVTVNSNIITATASTIVTTIFTTTAVNSTLVVTDAMANSPISSTTNSANTTAMSIDEKPGNHNDNDDNISADTSTIVAPVVNAKHTNDGIVVGNNNNATADVFITETGNDGGDDDDVKLLDDIISSADCDEITADVFECSSTTVVVDSTDVGDSVDDAEKSSLCLMNAAMVSPFALQPDINSSFTCTSSLQNTTRCNDCDCGEGGNNDQTGTDSGPSSKCCCCCDSSKEGTSSPSSRYMHYDESSSSFHAVKSGNNDDGVGAFMVSHNQNNAASHATNNTNVTNDDRNMNVEQIANTSRTSTIEMCKDMMMERRPPHSSLLTTTYAGANVGDSATTSHAAVGTIPTDDVCLAHSKHRYCCKQQNPFDSGCSLKIKETLCGHADDDGGVGGGGGSSNDEKDKMMDRGVKNLSNDTIKREIMKTMDSSDGDIYPIEINVTEAKFDDNNKEESGEEIITSCCALSAANTRSCSETELSAVVSAIEEEKLAHHDCLLDNDACKKGKFGSKKFIPDGNDSDNDATAKSIVATTMVVTPLHTTFSANNNSNNNTTTKPFDGAFGKDMTMMIDDGDLKNGKECISQNCSPDGDHHVHHGTCSSILNDTSDTNIVLPPPTNVNNISSLISNMAAAAPIDAEMSRLLDANVSLPPERSTSLSSCSVGHVRPFHSSSAGKVYPANKSKVFNPQNPNAPPIYPCGVCHKEVHDNDQAMLCESGCNFWFHRSCTGLTEAAYQLLTAEVYAEWVCDKCLTTKNIPLVKYKP